MSLSLKLPITNFNPIIDLQSFSWYAIIYILYEKEKESIWKKKIQDIFSELPVS